MKPLVKWVAPASLAAAIIPLPALGHHSFAMFDQAMETRLKSLVVTRFEWTNPHVFVIGTAGSITYTLECSSPNLMGHQGWKHNTLTPGTRIDVAFYPLRNGKPGGMLKTVTLPGGKSMSAW
jgi:hypothetical protein